MRNLINKIPLIQTAIFFFVFSLVFINFFINSKYMSQSIIDVSLNGNESISSSIVGSFFSDTGSKTAYQVKSFIESKEASKQFFDRSNVNTLFNNEDLTYFSKLTNVFNRSFHEYFQKMINVYVDGDSDALVIETFAFSAEDAKYINLQIINMTSDFFNNKARLASLNSRSNKICELYIANAGIFEIDKFGVPDDSQVVNSSNSATELLIGKTEIYKNYCLEKLEKLPENRKKIDVDIPSYELKNINAEASRKILTDLYQKSMDIVSEADYMEIIAEPISPQEPERKRSLLKSTLVFFIAYIVLLSLKIVVRLSNEFIISK